jgi:predicted protein tyrosine phosphatase
MNGLRSNEKYADLRTKRLRCFGISNDFEYIKAEKPSQAVSFY